MNVSKEQRVVVDGATIYRVACYGHDDRWIHTVFVRVRGDDPKESVADAELYARAHLRLIGERRRPSSFRIRPATPNELGMKAVDLDRVHIGEGANG